MLNPPSMLHVTDATLTNVTFAWSPATIDPGEVILSYQYRVDSGPAVDVGLGLNVTADIPSPEPGAMFAVQVRTRYDVGIGSETEATTGGVVSEWTTALNVLVPHGSRYPPSKPRATATTKTSMDFEWDAPPPATGEAVIGYQYRLNTQSPIHVGLTLNASVLDLVPGTENKVQVRALYSEVLLEPIDFYFDYAYSVWSEHLIYMPPPDDRVVWNAPEERFFETGIDRGVIYPKTGPAVAWNGLMSVDESGAETGEGYYLDGRPYLFLDKPKEYSATVNAYTYPDELGELMGVAEVADGMYLDSQIGGTFDFSYRTLVGNGLEGVDHAYKIHLIYNATATPQGVTYTTASSSMEIAELSWEIRAVPVGIVDRRATAHVIVDTRRVDPVRLALLESKLYLREQFSLPSPDELLELLKLSRDIRIDELDAYTWMAESSSENITILSDDYFRIDNVNATFDANGNTFTIEDTVNS